MSDADLKRCDDYSSVGISLCGDANHWYVEREGRRISTHDTYNEAAMFAEELYERIVRAILAVGA